MWNDKPENYGPHDHGLATFTITSENLDGPLVVDGLNRITIAFTDDDFTLTRAASGMTAVNRIRSTNGTAEIEVQDSSPSIKLLSDLANLKEAVAFVYTDPNRPDLNCSCNYCFFTKHPDVVMEAETGMSVFALLCPVLNAKTGGFTVKVAT